jgi:hypothetical protein
LTVQKPKTAETTLRGTLEVPTGELRSAFKAVLPHSSSLRDDVVLGRVQARWKTGELLVMGSDRRTVGLGHVSILDHRDGSQTGTFDLTRAQVREILALFKRVPARDAGEVDEVLRLTVAVDTITVTEAGGLFEGKAYVMPRIPAVSGSGYPDLPELVAHGLTRARTDADIVTLDGDALARFKAASDAYNADLQVEPTGDHTALIVSCGQQFVGLVMPTKLDEAAMAAVKGWRAEWLALLPDADADLLFRVDVPLPSPKGGDDIADPEDDGIRPATGGLAVVPDPFTPQDNQ